MRRAWFALVTALFFVLPLSAYGSSQCDSIQQLVEARTFPERSARIRALFSLGAETIPTLIEEVASSRKVSVILTEPTSSTIEGPLWRYCGVIAAYLLETLLARTDLALTDPPQPDAGFFLGSTSNDYVYTQGVIKKSDGRLVGRGDLRRVQSLYLAWWESRKNKTLEQLREEWRNGPRALAGSDFHWE